MASLKFKACREQFRTIALRVHFLLHILIVQLCCTFLQALSQTEWITTYILRETNGSRINYQLNIIDTPGFGDTRGVERDQQIVTQIRKLFCGKGLQGVAMIDAVCFLAKAPDARLTAVQRYIFQSVMSLFGKDIEKNICCLITFADGKSPPVLAALKEAKLPFGKCFTFNNSGLFASNDEMETLSQMFWDIGLRNFKNFFTHLETLQTRSLALTKDVLIEREKLENTIERLQPQVTLGISKVHQLNDEVKILEENKSEIDRNAKFEYTVSETKQELRDLPAGQHVTNCKQCNFTCHENCAYANDDEKKLCIAMDSDGYCEICPERCFWQMHVNTPYIFTLKTVMVQKTYEDMQKRYKDASGKLPNQKQVIQRMRAEIKDLIITIEQSIKVVKDCNVRLREIALRPNPLSVSEYIEILINSEKLEKKDGFIERIEFYIQLKERAEMEQTAEKFNKQARDVVSAADAATSKCSVFQKAHDLMKNFKGFFSN